MRLLPLLILPDPRLSPVAFPPTEASAQVGAKVEATLAAQDVKQALPRRKTRSAFRI